MTLAKRIVARHVASIKTAVSPLEVPYEALQRSINEWTYLSEDGGPVTKALITLDKIETLLGDDQDFQRAFKPYANAIQQRSDELKKMLHKGQMAAKHINIAHRSFKDALSDSPGLK